MATLIEILNEAQTEAHQSASDFIAQHGEGFPCGFAWLSIYKFEGKKIRGNSKLGKALKAIGIEQNYERTFQIWNPSGLSTQSIDAKEAGARAAANVFQKHGFEAYAGSRLD